MGNSVIGMFENPKRMSISCNTNYVQVGANLLEKVGKNPLFLPINLRQISKNCRSARFGEAPYKKYTQLPPMN
jgi:hypothetical protein